MSKLIVSGCSYSADYAAFSGIPTHPLYSHMLASDRSMEHINLAVVGNDNKTIFEDALDHIDDHVGLLVVQWSEFYRVYKTKDELAILGKVHADSMTTLDEFCRYAYWIQEVCEGKGIPYIQFMGPEPWSSGYEEIADGWKKVSLYDVGKYMTSNKYYQFINSNFLGWPIMRGLGGWSIDDYFEKAAGKKNNEFIYEYPTDFHPNKLGHLKIRLLLDEHYKKNYN